MMWTVTANQKAHRLMIRQPPTSILKHHPNHRKLLSVWVETLCVCLCVTNKMMPKTQNQKLSLKLRFILGYHNMNVPEMIWDMGNHCLVFLLEYCDQKRWRWRNIWIGPIPLLVLLLDRDPTPFSIAFYCYWTNFLLASLGNVSIGDDDHHHIHDYYDDDDDGDD